MRTRRTFAIFAAVVIGVLVLSALLRQQVAQRDWFDDQNIVFKDSVTLSSAHDDDLIAGGERVTLDSGSVVAGSATLLGETVQVGGTVKGDLTILSGTITFAPDAQINGDANLMGTDVTLDGQVSGSLRVTADHLIILPTARIDGVLNACSENLTDQRANAARANCEDDGFNPFEALVSLRSTAMSSAGAGGATLGARIDTLAALIVAIFSTIVLAGSSALVVTLFPRQISHIEEAMRARPRSFCGAGIAVYALIIGVFFAFVLLLANVPPLGLLLIPLLLLAGLLLIVLNLAGLVTLALVLGEVLLHRLNQQHVPPLIAAITGSLLISVVLGGIALLPFGFVISFGLLALISTVGLGAALFTRIGTRSVRRTYFVTG